MKNWRTRLVAVALVALAVLASGALLGSDTAVAAPCCSSCDAGYDNCVANCGQDPACWDACDAYWFRCYRWCIFSC